MLDPSRNGFFMKSLRRNDNVLQDRANCHWPNPARYRSYHRSNVESRIVVDVSNQSLAGLFGGIWAVRCGLRTQTWYIIDTNIDDNRARLQPISFDVIRYS